MTDSPPSRENRFWPTNFVCRKVSNASAALRRSMMWVSSALSKGSRGVSIFCWIHWRSSGSEMCMYSTPMVRQYASRSTPRMSRSVIWSLPPTPRVGKVRSRSHSVRP